MKYLFCLPCGRGYVPSEWELPEGTTEADFEKPEHSFRHRKCPEGHPFEGDPCWQSEEQYQQDRAAEARASRAD